MSGAWGAELSGTFGSLFLRGPELFARLGLLRRNRLRVLHEQLDCLAHRDVLAQPLVALRGTRRGAAPRHRDAQGSRAARGAREADSGGAGRGARKALDPGERATRRCRKALHPRLLTSVIWHLSSEL